MFSGLLGCERGAEAQTIPAVCVWWNGKTEKQLAKLKPGAAWHSTTTNAAPHPQKDPLVYKDYPIIGLHKEDTVAILPTPHPPPGPGPKYKSYK